MDRDLRMSSDTFRVEEVEAETRPPRARVEDAAEASGRQRDYLDGFLKQAPQGDNAHEPGGALYEAVIDDVVEVRVTQVGAFWITSKPVGKDKGNLSLPEPEKAKKEETEKKEEPKASTEIADPAVKAQFESMKESLGMAERSAGDAA